MGIEFSHFENAVSRQSENSGVFARFYDKPVQTGNIKKNGLPEFKTKLYVEIKVRDERDVFDQPAGVEHIERFSAEYNKYLRQKQETGKGTPLTLFAFLDAGQIECCHLRGIFSVEDLAALEDKKADMLGLKDEKKSACLFLEAAKNNFSIASFEQKEKYYLEQINILSEELKRLKANDNERQ